MATNETKWTPGPWKAMPFGEDPRWFLVVKETPRAMLRIAKVAALPSDFEMGDRPDPNARLIAAAPEMAEALREVERELDAVLAGTVTLDAETLLATVSAALAKTEVK